MRKTKFTALFSVFAAAFALIACLSLSVAARDPVLSVGKPYTYSSTQTDSGQGENTNIKNINDGSETTRWTASNISYPQWVTIDLEGWYDVSEIEILFYRPTWDTTRHYQYKLWYSVSGDDYKLFDGGDMSANSDTVIKKAHSVSAVARFVKLEMLSSSSSSAWASVYEFSVFGVPTTATVATVEQVEDLPQLTVDYGTPLASLGLPETASVLLADGQGIINAELLWNSEIYTPNVAGTYNLVGTIVGLPAGVKNPNGKAVHRTVVVREENYKPPVVVRDKQIINDGWKFFDGMYADGGKTLVDDSSWESINLPHTWNAADGCDGGSYRQGDGWYRKNVFVPDSKSSGRVYVEFDGACVATDLYVNGNHVGETHYGGYTRFRYDITDYVFFDSNNLLAVKVNNKSNDVPPVGGDFTRQGGIHRSVSLIYTNDVHATLDDLGSPGVYITPERQGETSTWKISINAAVTNSGDEARNLTVKTILREPDSFESIPEIPADKTPFDESTMYGNEIYDTDTKALSATVGDTPFETSLTIENPRLWNGRNDPYRYAVDFEIYDGETLLDKVTQYVGFRYFSIDPEDGFYLNGNKYPLRGVGYHEDTEENGSALTVDDWNLSFSLVYEIGATSVRLVHYPHDPYSYELCDKYGIVSWTELAQISGINENEAYYSRAKNELRELIRQNKNCPSVCFWGIQNEVGVGKANPYGDTVDAFMNELHAIAKEEDPTRLTTQASCNWKINASEWFTDVLAFNSYPLWYAGGNLGTTADSWKNTNMAESSYWNGKPIGVSEYGSGASIYHHSEFPTQPVTTGNFHPEEWASVVHEAALKAIKERDYLWFTSVWCMFDFASDSRKEGDHLGINDKGLVTRDRSVNKDAFYLYKANWRDAALDPFVHINMSRKVERDVASNTVTVYSNLDSVELFRNNVSLGMMTNEGDGIFTMADVSFGSIGESAEYKAVSGSHSDTVTWTHVASSSIEFTATQDNIYIHNGESTILLSGAFTADMVSEMFHSDYNATFSVINDDLTTPVTSGAIEAGMRIIITAEDGVTSKAYVVISSSIAKGKPVTASSTGNSANSPDKAVDGIISTDTGYKWDASSMHELFPGAWIMVDLEKEYTLTRSKINFFPGWSNARKYTYKIYAGSTPDNLTMIVDRSNNTEVGEINDLLSDIKARYFKVEIITNSDYVSGNATAVPSILEIEVNGYNISSETLLLDSNAMTVTIPASMGLEVSPSQMLAAVKVDGNAILSFNAEAYYLQAGDKLIVTDYAGKTTEYAVTFEKSSDYIIAASIADIDSSKKNTHTFAVKKTNTEVVNHLLTGGYKFAYIGDLNSDGNIDSSDLLLYIKKFAGSILPSAVSVEVSDYDGNGYVGLSDISVLMHELAALNG